LMNSRRLEFRRAAKRPSDRVCHLDAQEALVTAPTRVSPAPTAEQKHNGKNDQYSFPLDPAKSEGSWLTRLTSSVGSIIKRDEDGNLFT
jgi:hypothetical protein